MIHRDKPIALWLLTLGAECIGDAGASPRLDAIIVRLVAIEEEGMKCDAAYSTAGLHIYTLGTLKVIGHQQAATDK